MATNAGPCGVVRCQVLCGLVPRMSRHSVPAPANGYRNTQHATGRSNEQGVRISSVAKIVV